MLAKQVGESYKMLNGPKRKEFVLIFMYRPNNAIWKTVLSNDCANSYIEDRW